MIATASPGLLKKYLAKNHRENYVANTAMQLGTAEVC